MKADTRGWYRDPWEMERVLRETVLVVERCRTRAEAARTLGISLNSLASRLKRARDVLGLRPALEQPSPVVVPPEPLAPPAAEMAAPAVVDAEKIREDQALRRRLHALEDQNARLKKQLKDIDIEQATTEALREQVFGLVRRPPEPPPWVAPRETEIGSKTPGLPMTLWSDWHAEEVVDSAAMGGLNVYNPDVFRDRVTRLVAGIEDILLNHAGRGHWPGIHVALNGDLVTGEIHQELSVTNALTPPLALLLVQNEIVRAINRLVEVFGRVWVTCCPGNHGRGTMKPWAKQDVKRSWEYYIYLQLEAYYADRQRDLAEVDKPVTFLVSNTGDLAYSVYGRRFAQTHGDRMGVKGGDGIIGAIGPIMRGAVKFYRSEAHTLGHYDTLLLGHWHQYLPMSQLTVNGSLIGPTEYSKMMRFPYEPPQQALWVTHPRWGMVGRWPVQVAEPPGAPVSTTILEVQS